MNGAMKCEIYCSQWEQRHNCHLHPPSLHFSHCSRLIRQAAFDKKSPCFILCYCGSGRSPTVRSVAWRDVAQSSHHIYHPSLYSCSFSELGGDGSSQEDDAIQTQGWPHSTFSAAVNGLKYPEISLPGCEVVEC